MQGNPAYEALETITQTSPALGQEHRLQPLDGTGGTELCKWLVDPEAEIWDVSAFCYNSSYIVACFTVRTYCTWHAVHLVYIVIPHLFHSPCSGRRPHAGQPCLWSYWSYLPMRTRSGMLKFIPVEQGSMYMNWWLYWLCNCNVFGGKAKCIKRCTYMVRRGEG